MVYNYVGYTTLTLTTESMPRFIWMKTHHGVAVSDGIPDCVPCIEIDWLTSQCQEKKEAGNKMSATDLTRSFYCACASEAARITI